MKEIRGTSGFLIDKSSQADGNTIYAAAKEFTAEAVRLAHKGGRDLAKGGQRPQGKNKDA